MARRCAGAGRRFRPAPIQPRQCRGLADLLGTALGQCGEAVMRQHPAIGTGQRLARQHAADAGEDGVGPGGELELQQLVARRRSECARGTMPAASNACGSEAKARQAGVCGDVERLDAERVARKRDGALRPARGSPAHTCRAACRQKLGPSRSQSLQRRPRCRCRWRSAHPASPPASRRNCRSRRCRPGRRRRRKAAGRR